MVLWCTFGVEIHCSLIRECITIEICEHGTAAGVDRTSI
jgi:hypothetical protein